MSRYHATNTNSTLNCGCYFIILLLNAIIGQWSVNYLLQEFLGKTIPIWGAVLIGCIVAEVSVPVAIVIWLLKLFGIM